MSKTKLVEVKLLDTHHYSSDEQQAIKDAVVWGSEPYFGSEGQNNGYDTFLAWLHKMPAVPFTVRKVISPYMKGVDDDGGELRAHGPMKRLQMVETAEGPQRVQIQIPGLGLMNINQSKILEDACTDDLNNQLASGWRILAICPQPNQRRPDYVLGRTASDRQYRDGDRT